jgi:hypothetical protein
MLFGPATEACTFVVIAPAIAWSLVDAYRTPGHRLSRLPLPIALLMMGPLVTDAAGATIRDFANGHGCQPLGALLYLGCLLGQTGRVSRADPTLTTVAPPAPIAA